MSFKNRKNINLDEWYDIVNPILTSKEYQRRKSYRHHGDTTVFEHCVNVSIISYSLAKKLELDYRSAAIAGLLHDFYETPWQDVIIKNSFFKKHGFTHAKNALDNSRRHYKKYLNPIIENSIERHMFPLNKIPPKYKVGYIITFVDKAVSLDMLMSKESILKTLGLVRRS